VQQSGRKKHYGFIKEASKGEDQQAQTAEEVAPAPTQEAHLAEVILPVCEVFC
jgi:hypothetical protein